MQEADDLVQAACERGLNKIDRWKPGTRLDSWMFRILQNIFLDNRRKHKLRGDPVSPDNYRQVVDTQSQRLPEIRNNLSLVAEAMTTLPEEQRVVLMLVCIEEHSYKEAAQIIGVPVGTIMSRLARARINLSKLLENNGGAEGDYKHG
jgi:RNA polymerase sigma-70 factor (ECF subfamily)